MTLMVKIKVKMKVDWFWKHMFCYLNVKISKPSRFYYLSLLFSFFTSICNFFHSYFFFHFVLIYNFVFTLLILLTSQSKNKKQEEEEARKEGRGRKTIVVVCVLWETRRRNKTWLEHHILTLVLELNGLFTRIDNLFF